jgi:hypothetical protein
MGIGKDGFLAVAPSAPPTPSRGIIIIIIIIINTNVQRLEAKLPGSQFWKADAVQEV